MQDNRGGSDDDEDDDDSGGGGGITGNPSGGSSAGIRAHRPTAAASDTRMHTVGPQQIPVCALSS